VFFFVFAILPVFLFLLFSLFLFCFCNSPCFCFVFAILCFLLFLLFSPFCFCFCYSLCLKCNLQKLWMSNSILGDMAIGCPFPLVAPELSIYRQAIGENPQSKSSIQNGSAATRDASETRNLIG
jgi:hypothetical protein